MRASNGGERRSYYDFRMTLVMVTLVPAKMRVGSAFGDKSSGSREDGDYAG